MYATVGCLRNVFCEMYFYCRRAQVTGGGGGGGGGMYSTYKSVEDDNSGDDRRSTARITDVDDVGRFSRLSVDRSLERVRETLEREFEDRKLELFEVGMQVTRHYRCEICCR